MSQIFFGFGPSRLIMQGLSVRQYIEKVIKRDVPFWCVLLVFGPYRPENEIFYLKKTANSDFK